MNNEKTVKGLWAVVKINSNRSSTHIVPNYIPVKIEDTNLNSVTFHGWAYGERLHEYPRASIMITVETEEAAMDYINSIKNETVTESEARKRISYRGYIIRPRKSDDGELYYDIIKPKWSTTEPIWDWCDSVEEAKAWIDSDKDNVDESLNESINVNNAQEGQVYALSSNITLDRIYDLNGDVIDEYKDAKYRWVDDAISLVTSATNGNVSVSKNRSTIKLTPGTNLRVIKKLDNYRNKPTLLMQIGDSDCAIILDPWNDLGKMSLNGTPPKPPKEESDDMWAAYMVPDAYGRIDTDWKWTSKDYDETEKSFKARVRHQAKSLAEKSFREYDPSSIKIKYFKSKDAFLSFCNKIGLKPRLEESKSIKEDLDKKPRIVDTGLTTDAHYNILKILWGQLSDGYWESDKEFRPYWTGAKPIKENGKVYIEVYPYTIDLYGNKEYSFAYHDYSDTRILKKYAELLRALFVVAGVFDSTNEDDATEVYHILSGDSINESKSIKEKYIDSSDVSGWTQNFTDEKFSSIGEYKGYTYGKLVSPKDVSGWYLIDGPDNIVIGNLSDNTYNSKQELMSALRTELHRLSLTKSKSIKEEFNIQDYYNQTLNKFNNIYSGVNDDYDTFETGVELAIQDLTDGANKSELFRCDNREAVKTFTDKLVNTREYDTLKVYPEVKNGYYNVIDYLNRLVNESKLIKEGTDEFTCITVLADDCGKNTFKISSRDIRFTFDSEDDKTKFANELLAQNIAYSELPFGVISINKSAVNDDVLTESEGRKATHTSTVYLVDYEDGMSLPFDDRDTAIDYAIDSDAKQVVKANMYHFSDDESDTDIDGDNSEIIWTAYPNPTTENLKESLSDDDYLYCQACITDDVRDYLTDDELAEISDYIGSDGTIINCESGRCDIKFSDEFVAHQIPIEYLEVELDENLKESSKSDLYNVVDTQNDEHPDNSRVYTQAQMYDLCKELIEIEEESSEPKVYAKRPKLDYDLKSITAVLKWFDYEVKPATTTTTENLEESSKTDKFNVIDTIGDSADDTREYNQAQMYDFCKELIEIEEESSEPKQYANRPKLDHDLKSITAVLKHFGYEVKPITSVKEDLSDCDEDTSILEKMTNEGYDTLDVYSTYEIKNADTDEVIRKIHTTSMDPDDSSTWFDDDDIISQYADDGIIITRYDYDQGMLDKSTVIYPEEDEDAINAIYDGNANGICTEDINENETENVQKWAIFADDIFQMHVNGTEDMAKEAIADMQKADEEHKALFIANGFDMPVYRYELVKYVQSDNPEISNMFKVDENFKIRQSNGIIG